MFDENGIVKILLVSESQNRTHLHDVSLSLRIVVIDHKIYLHSPYGLTIGIILWCFCRYHKLNKKCLKIYWKGYYNNLYHKYIGMCRQKGKGLSHKIYSLISAWNNNKLKVVGMTNYALRATAAQRTYKNPKQKSQAYRCATTNRQYNVPSMISHRIQTNLMQAMAPKISSYFLVLCLLSVRNIVLYSKKLKVFS